MSGQFRTCCSFASTLEADEHDDIRLALLGLVWLGMGVNEGDKVVEYGFLYDTFLVR
jgi:hypothetical protein